MDKSPRKVIDWGAVEAQYCAGIRSLKDIGAEYGVSDAGILKRAKRDGWVKDLKARIIAKADAKVSAAAVSAEVSQKKAANQQQVVEANAELQYRIRIEHRQDIRRARNLFQTLIGEIEAATDPEGAALIEQLADLVDGPESEDPEDGRKRASKMREKLNKVLDGPTRVTSAKQLVEMLEKLVRMEREAFGIDDKRSAPATGAINISF